MNPLLDNMFISLAFMLSVTFAIIIVINKSKLEKTYTK